MFKRLVAVAAAAVIALAVAGCSSGASSSAASSSSASASATSASSASTSSSSASSSLFSDLKWPENEITEGVPVPNFSVGIDSLNENEMGVSATWKGITDQEALDYVEQVKAAGFTFKASENKGSNTYNYSAQNKEEYQDFTSVSVMYAAASENAPSQFTIMVMRYK